MGTNCTAVSADGRLCHKPTFIFDPRTRGMLCREHALEPVIRMFGDRPDVEEKAEYVLRFLALPSNDRRELLESLGAEERRSFIEMAALFQD